MENYWVVGSNWDGLDQQDAFYRRGYWEMGYADDDKPKFAEKRDSMKEGDKIAIKSRNGKGKSTITIHGLGIIEEVSQGKVYVDWKVTDLNRKVHSKGAFGTIHGPYKFEDNWTKEVFCL